MQPDALVIDEAHAFKTLTSKRTKMVLKLADYIHSKNGYVVTMSGTPFAKDIRDGYSQCCALDKALFPYSFTEFNCLQLNNILKEGSEFQIIAVISELSSSFNTSIPISSLLIDKIYDSIGTCNECEHGHTTKAGKGFRLCDDGKGLQKENWYCADFKRREDG